MSREGRPQKPAIDWTLERAAREFRINSRTLRNRIDAAGLKEGPEGYWTTQQICQAIYSGLEHERIRKTKAEADQIEMQNRKLSGELVDLEEFAKQIEPAILDVKRIVMASPLPDAAKDELLARLTEVVGGGK